MITELAARVQRIKPSPTMAVAAKADELKAAGKNIISLSIGEPDFDTPDHIKAAAIKAIQDGQTKYTAVEGTLALRQAIVQKFLRDNQLKYDTAQILVSCGAKHSLSNLFSAVLNPGDEVVIAAPYWVSYPDMVKLADGNPVIISADHTQNFKITPSQLAAAITPKTRIFIINSPSNPTGVAYTAEELRALAEVLLKHPHVLIASDDIYEHTLWKAGSFTNLPMVCPALYDRTIVVNGVSKTYAMTGWRIGYAAGDAKLIASMKKIQSQTTSNPASISQAAALAALNGDQSCITTMTQAYHKRHDFILQALRHMPGITCLPSDGTFYAFPYVEEAIKKSTTVHNDLELSEYLLNTAEIAVVPGSAFGAPGYIRLSYATSMEKIEEAMQRMQKAMENLK